MLSLYYSFDSNSGILWLCLQRAFGLLHSRFLSVVPVFAGVQRLCPALTGVQVLLTVDVREIVKPHVVRPTVRSREDGFYELHGSQSSVHWEGCQEMKEALVCTLGSFRYSWGIGSGSTIDRSQRTFGLVSYYGDAYSCSVCTYRYKIYSHVALFQMMPWEILLRGEARGRDLQVIIFVQQAIVDSEYPEIQFTRLPSDALTSAQRKVMVKSILKHTSKRSITLYLLFSMW